MKKSIFKKIGGLFLGLAMGLGVAVGVTAGNKASEVKAATKTYSHSFGSSAPSGAKTGTNNMTFSSVTWSCTINYTGSSNGWQLSSNNSKSTASFSTTAFSDYKIHSVSLGWYTNSKKTVTWSAQVGETTLSEKLGNSSGTGSGTKTFDFSTTKPSGKITISSSGATGGYAITSIGVVYEEIPTGFTLSYDANKPAAANGSVGNMPTNPSDKATSFTVDSKVPTLTGYTFKGWGMQSSGIADANLIQAGGATGTISQNTTLYAYWAINKYTVSGTITNGSIAPTSNVSYDTEYSGTITPATNCTYPDSLTVTMGGNTLVADTDYLYDNAEGTLYIGSVTGNLVISGACVPEGTAYTVTYNANSGTVSPASEQIIENGHPSFPTPTRSGFNFKGWQVDGSGTLYTQSSEYTVTGDVNFVASWAALYTVSFNSDGGSASPASIEVEDGNAFSFPSAGTKTHYTFDGWSSDGGTNKYKSGTSPAVTANTAYTAYWVEDAKYTVTYVAGSNGSGNNYPHENQYSGTYTLLPFESTGLAAAAGYRFKDYTVNGVSKEPGATIDLTGPTEVTANFEVLPLIDTLNREFTGIENGSTTYATWSGKTHISSAVYAGNSAGGSDSIQLRSKNSDSGIITTASGGLVKEITVVWNNSSASGRTIDIYGKNTSYSEPADLFNTDKQGTKIGSIENGTSTKLTVSGDYAYIGIRSKESALYLTEIQIEWKLPNTLTSVSTSGQKQTFTAGETFSYGGTLTAHYSVNADAGVTPKEFRWGSATGSEIDATKALTISDNGKVVYVIYEEGDVTADAHYSITVNYKPASGIELDYSSYKLPLNGSFELTATVSDEYADPEAVSWSSDNEDIALVDETGKTVNVIAGENSGTAVITATANGHSATCTVTVSADAIVTLDRESIEAYSGDDSITLSASADNFDEDATLDYDWEIVGDSGIVALSENDDKCTVSFVSGGTVSVKVTVSDGTTTKDASCSVVVTQSEVTNLTLTSSVDGGAIYNGPYLSTLTLTPNITKSGNATKTINWTKSNNNVNISATQTSNGDPITVTGVTAGTTVITATSAYTSSISATYTVTVTADGVTSLSWGTRGTIECFEGTKLKDAVNTEAWVFTPTWTSEYEDTPEFGTGEDDVHIGLYETSPSNGGQTTPKSEEATPISADYSFTALDNGKVIAACYRGTFSTNNKKISIIPLLNDISEEKTEKTTENESVTFKLSSVPSNKISSSGNEKGVDIDLDTNIHLDGLKGTATTPTRFWTSSSKTQLRTYKGNQLKFTASNGYKITKITCTNITDGSYTNADGVTEITIDAVASQNSNDIVVEYIKVIENTVTVHYTNTNLVAQKAVIDFSNYFINTLNESCADFDTTSESFIEDWSDVANYYSTVRSSLSSDEVALSYFDAMIKKAVSTSQSFDSTGYDYDENADILQSAVYRYERIVKRDSNLTKFLSGQRTVSAPKTVNPIASLSNVDNSVWIISAVALVGLTAIGGYFFYRKRKEN